MDLDVGKQTAKFVVLGLQPLDLIILVLKIPSQLIDLFALPVVLRFESFDSSDDERLAVQVTPYCDEPVRPQVTDRSTDRIVVKDFSDGPDEYNFAYTVKGVRQGFEDQQVVSDSS